MASISRAGRSTSVNNSHKSRIANDTGFFLRLQVGILAAELSGSGQLWVVQISPLGRPSISLRPFRRLLYPHGRYLRGSWKASLSPVEGISLTRSPYHLQRYHIPEPVLWPKVAVSGQKLPEKENFTLFIQFMQRYSAMRRTWAAV